MAGQAEPARKQNGSRGRAEGPPRPSASALLTKRFPLTPPHQDPLYAPVYDQSLADFRDLTLRRLVAYVRAKNERGFFSVRDYVRDPRRFMAGLETLAMADYSLCIKVSLCVER